MDKSGPKKSSEELRLEGSRENQQTATTKEITPDNQIQQQIDEDLFVCQMQIVKRAKSQKILRKSMCLLLTAREEILLYNNHAEQARRKLKEAREAIYLMDVDDINLAAEFEENIQAAIKRLTKLEEKQMSAEDKSDLSQRIVGTEEIVKLMQNHNDMVYENLEKEIVKIMQFRQDATVRRNQPLATEKKDNDNNWGSANNPGD